MYGVILIAHGSEKSSADNIVAEISKKTEKLLRGAQVKYGFLKHNDFDKIVSNFVSNGIHEIIVLPYFLYDGPHVRRDIRNIAEDLSLRHPQMKITIAEHLGIDERLAEIAADRVTDRRGKNGV